MKTEYFKTIIDHMSEGVVIMDRLRVIHYINVLAREWTGWKVNETVPYCSYCKTRSVEPGEERCLLVQDNSTLVFQAHMPTYQGLKEEFHMSTSALYLDGEKYNILILRNPKWNVGNRDKKIRQLLVQETMMAQEAERKRISMELHDHIGQEIFGVFLGLQGLKCTITDEKNQKHIQNMEKSLENALEDVKRLSKELHPVSLDYLGIEKALDSVLVDWQDLYQVTITKDMIHIKEEEISREISLHLFRVIQEAVHNAVRHGKAKNIHILLRGENGKLLFQIVDDGKGFDMHEKKQTGLGLSHIIERITMVGGEVKFYSRKGGPTKVEGFIPMDME